MKALLDEEVKRANGATAVLKPLKDPTSKTGGKQDQWVYTFPDGTEVRIKEKGDPYRKQPGATFAIEVKDVSAPVVPNDPQANILFKVDANTRPVPKGAEDELDPPYKEDVMGGEQRKAWIRAVCDAGHRMANT